jgi:hypothetical protein
VSVTEPRDAVTAGMTKQTEGRHLRFCSSLCPQLAVWLVGSLVGPGFLFGFLNLEVGPNNLSHNVCKEVPLPAA